MNVTTVARSLLELVSAEGASPSCLTGDVDELERVLREQAQRVAARAAELHLAGRPLGYEGSGRACPTPGCGRNQRFVGYRPRTLATLVGPVTLERAYYHCPRCGSGCCPYDAACGLGPGQE